MRTIMRVAAVVLVIALAGAIGYGVWNAGYEQGLVEATDATTEIVVTQSRGGFFPFGAIFGFFFLFFLFGLIFKFAFGWRRWGGHYRGAGPSRYSTHMGERLTQWHDEAHGKSPPTKVTSDPQGPVS